MASFFVNVNRQNLKKNKKLLISVVLFSFFFMSPCVAIDIYINCGSINTENTAQATFIRLPAWDCLEPRPSTIFWPSCSTQTVVFTCFHLVVWLANFLPLPVLFHSSLSNLTSEIQAAAAWLSAEARHLYHGPQLSHLRPKEAKGASLSFHVDSSDGPTFLTLFSGHVPILYPKGFCIWLQSERDLEKHWVAVILPFQMFSSHC